MPYNHIQLEKFVEKVNEEAEKAAQAVFDKYEAEFIHRVKSQLLNGDRICASMGTAYFANKELDSKILDVFAQSTQYTKQRASFTTYEISKP